MITIKIGDEVIIEDTGKMYLHYDFMAKEMGLKDYGSFLTHSSSYKNRVGTVIAIELKNILQVDVLLGVDMGEDQIIIEYKGVKKTELRDYQKAALVNIKKSWKVNPKEFVDIEPIFKYIAPPTEISYIVGWSKDYIEHHEQFKSLVDAVELYKSVDFDVKTINMFTDRQDNFLLEYESNP